MFMQSNVQLQMFQNSSIEKKKHTNLQEYHIV